MPISTNFVLCVNHFTKWFSKWTLEISKKNQILSISEEIKLRGLGIICIIPDIYTTKFRENYVLIKCELILRQ